MSDRLLLTYRRFGDRNILKHCSSLLPQAHRTARLRYKGCRWSGHTAIKVHTQAQLSCLERRHKRQTGTVTGITQSNTNRSGVQEYDMQLMLPEVECVHVTVLHVELSPLLVRRHTDGQYMHGKLC